VREGMAGLVNGKLPVGKPSDQKQKNKAAL
jgi:hypothetical protein